MWFITRLILTNSNRKSPILYLSSPSTTSHALWIKRFTVQKVLRWIRVAKLDRKRLDYVWYCAYTYKFQPKITYIVPSPSTTSHALWIKRFTVQKVLRWIRVAKLDRKRLDYVWYCAKLTWLSDVVTHIRLPSSCGLVVAPIQKDTDSKGSVRIKN